MSSVVDDALQGYVAGRVKAERVVAAVAGAYYANGGRAAATRLRPLMDVIERAAPGVVELTGTTDRPGFDLRPKERPFPKQYETELRRAAEAYLGRGTAGKPAGEGGRGLIARMRGALRRLLGL